MPAACCSSHPVQKSRRAPLTGYSLQRSKLDEERNEAVADLEEFVSKSSICAHISDEQFQCARREFDPKTKPEPSSPLKHHVHFDYRPFPESEVNARCISHLLDSESESGSCSSTE
ncbi:hypothetical protein Tcan_16133 [Toxocara canis]|uniref:Uncharacterized protein n=1 Tax=Toxocara canis TaxID=6265 RepID=A0A0B2VU67_TOXCA|nr:hypothetical protein Tcan_16133 [Toxocara canis]